MKINEKRFRFFTIVSFSALFLIITGMITVLLYFYISFRQKLTNVTRTIDELASAEFVYNVHVQDTILVVAEAEILKDILVGADAVVEQEFSIKVNVPINHTFNIPVNLNLNEVINVDTLAFIKDEIKVRIDDTILLDQKVKIPVIGDKGINKRVVVDVSVNEDITGYLIEPVRVISSVPARLDFSEIIPVHLEVEVPVDMVIPVKVPVSTDVLVKVKEIVPVKSYVPIKADIPIVIKVNETILKDYLEEVSKQMDDFLNL